MALCSHWSPRGDRGEIYKRGELTHTRSVCVGVAETGGKPSYMTFAALFVSEKRDKGKVTLSKKNKSFSSVNSQNKRYRLHPLSRRRQHTCSAYVLIPAFSFDEAGAKEKAIKKKTPSKRFRALRSACPVSATPTHMLRICVNSRRYRRLVQAFEKA